MTDKNEIERLFKSHYAQMFRLAAGLLHDDDLARDIVHDVFASLLAGSYQIAVTPSYLLKAVRNRSLNHIRNCDIHMRVANRFFLTAEEFDTEDWPDEETIAMIHRMIRNDISSKERRVLELRFSKGLKFSKIACEMGISETAVYRHLSHALKTIRQKLNENG
ncbi:MAG: sigma-70 family RNA polymerase sigma factor [Muribaculaceae bacterium]|nr:sigma-70 family RNA polymerase sigma factor [Muribaculaceae bacterium]